MTHYSIEASNPEYKGAPLPNSLEVGDVLPETFPWKNPAQFEIGAQFPPLGESGSARGILKVMAEDGAHLRVLANEEKDDEERARLKFLADQRESQFVDYVTELSEDKRLINLDLEVLPVRAENRKAEALARLLILKKSYDPDFIQEVRTLKQSIETGEVEHPEYEAEVKALGELAVSSETRVIEVQQYVETDRKEHKRFKKVLRESLHLSKRALEVVGILAPESANIDVVRSAPAPMAPIEYR